MLPVIVSVGPFALYSYGIALMVAFFAVLFVVWKRARELHFPEETLFDALFIVLGWAVVGARLGYIGLHLADFGLNPITWLNLIGKPGWWFMGGLVAGGISIWHQARQRKWEVYSVSDVLVTGLVLGQAIMALGAFFNGSGAGNITASFIGIRFVGMYDKRIPVQLFEWVAFTGCYLFLWWVESAYRTFSWYKGSRSEANSGFITAVYLMGFGLFEFGFSLMRVPTVVVAGIGGDSWLYLVVMGMGGWLLLHRSGVNYLKNWQQWRTKTAKKSPGRSRTAKLMLGEDIFG